MQPVHHPLHCGGVPPQVATAEDHDREGTEVLGGRLLHVAVELRDRDEIRQEDVRDDRRDQQEDPVFENALGNLRPVPRGAVELAARIGITVDQAFQFIVSCGVVIPIPQLQDRETNEVREMIESRIS